MTLFKKVVCFFMFFFLVVAFYLYLAGIREITYDNSIYWLRSLFDKYNTLSVIRLPDIPTWNYTPPGEPQWYEYVPMMLSYIVNFITGAYNTIVKGINFIGDMVKMCICIVWMFVDSWRLLIA